MGYKLAGFDVIGCNEIDPRMNKCYVSNHHPKLNYNCDIRELKNMELPEELYNLDILDGSPPCSAFSVVGSREDVWGVEKKFREGQAKQVLDTLFFDFIDLAKKLKPKVVVAENVKGLLLGNAKKYVSKIYAEFSDMYYVQHFLLDAQRMGVPQRRERAFFICLRKDLAEPFLYTANLFDKLPYINMDFNEPPITIEEAGLTLGDPITTKCYVEEYKNLKNGGKPKYFQCSLIKKTEVHPTLLASYRYKASPMPDWEMRWLSKEDICKVSSFPLDYDFCGEKPEYICGMSVPPVMMAQIATRIQTNWLQ